MGRMTRDDWREQLGRNLPGAPRTPCPMTRRERDTVGLAAQGLTKVEAAEALGLAESTVKRHLERARRRLGARNTAHVVAIAVRAGWV